MKDFSERFKEILVIDLKCLDRWIITQLVAIRLIKFDICFIASSLISKSMFDSCKLYFVSAVITIIYTA